MRILTVADKKSIVLSDKPMPPSRQGLPIIKVKYAGICGGDWHMVWKNGVRAGQNAVAGHEFYGVIEDPCGTDFKKGERVTAIEYSPCCTCEFCQRKLPHLCPSRFNEGVGLMWDGAFAEYVAVRADMIYRLPDAVDDIQAAMIEPCAVSMHGARLAGVQKGSKVLITGCGAIGLFAAAAAKALGAEVVVVTEIHPQRLALAEHAPFVDFAVNSATENLQDYLCDIAGGKFDCAVECSGNSIAATTALEAIKPGATMTILAYGPGPDIPYFNFINDEKRIQGAVFFTPNDFQTVIDMMASGKIDIKQYGEVILPQDVQETLQGLEDGTKFASKYLIDFEA